MDIAATQPIDDAVRCPRCGKRLRAVHEDDPAGLICLACGLRIPDEIAALLGVVPEPTVDEPLPANPPRLEPERAGRGLAAVLVAVAAAVTIGLAWMLVATGRDGPADKPTFAAEIIARKSEADALAGARRFAEAEPIYGEIADRIAATPDATADLRKLAQQARGDQLRMQEIARLDARPVAPAQVKTRAAATAPAVPSDATSQGGIATAPDANDAGQGGASAAQPRTNPIDGEASPSTIPARAGDNPGGIGASAGGLPSSTTSPVSVAAPAEPPRVGLRMREAVRTQDEVLDDQIGESIQQAVNFLIPKFVDGRLDLQGPAQRQDAYATGLDALCVYALLQAGQAIHDERLNPRGDFMRKLLASLKEMPTDNGPVVYARALRGTALAFLNRPEDRAAMRLDQEYLYKAQTNGAYSYSAAMRGTFDNSNSQYGLLGVWAVAESDSGVPVAPQYWTSVEHHWAEAQNTDGSWNYARAGRPGYLAMTVAGVASLFITQDYLANENAIGKPPFSSALERALVWLETDDRILDVNTTGWGAGYSLYGVERMALASGFKYFGTHDWYRELSRMSVASQNADGSWPRISFGRARAGPPQPGDMVETAYNLLFLSRGRHPVLMNKLRFGKITAEAGKARDPKTIGFWSNHPRDIANLARIAGPSLERPLNWQVVSVEHDWADWTDSPILYLASHVSPQLTDGQVDKIRAYVYAGGLLYTQADGGSAAFNKYAEELATRLFPKYEMRDLPQDSPLYSAVFPMKKPPSLRAVSNGSRLLMVHSPVDIAAVWQRRLDPADAQAGLRAQQTELMHFGINLFVYAAGKKDFRNRLASPYLAAPAGEPIDTLRIARIRYPNNWDPEPYAWTRYGRWMQNQTGIALDVRDFDLKDLAVQSAALAVITGTEANDLSDTDQAIIRDFVRDGGVLLADATGGSPAFYTSIRKSLRMALPDATGGYITPEHPLLKGGVAGMEDLTHVRVRLFAAIKGLQNTTPEVLRFGKGAAVICQLDVTTGILGANTWAIVGYDPAYAQQLVKNLLLWATAGLPQAR